MLYIVATPIGNLSEISERVIDVLKNSDFIVCEDTRVTLKILSNYLIKKPLIRYNEHSEESLENIKKLLSTGKKISIVSDAGVPCISDPGWKIVNYARKNNIEVEVVGINSAVVAALAGSGFDGSRFVFLGFLPRSKGKIKEMISKAFSVSSVIVLYESPNRLIELLEIIYEFFGNIDCVVARELTKIHEEWLYGGVKDLLLILKNRTDIRGEITLVLNNYKRDKKIHSVGFVCSGNTCRSVMAEYYMKYLCMKKNIEIKINSSGLCVDDRNSVSDNLIKLFEKEGIKNINHKPTQISRDFLYSNDLIFTMTREHRKKILLLFPEYEDKVFTILDYVGSSGDIYDPFGKDYIFYEMIFKKIKNAIEVLIDKIQRYNSSV